MTSASILVIENNTSVKNNIKALLETEGYQVETAANTSEGLALAMVSTPSLIVYGINQFIEQKLLLFCTQLKRSRELRLTPLIVMSKDRHFSKIMGLIKKGLVNDFIKKPASDTTLTERCQIILSQTHVNKHSRTSLHDTLEVIGELAGDLKDKNNQLRRQLKKQQGTYMEFIHTLARALESKDKYTAHHSTRVTKYALRTAAKLGLSNPQTKTLERASMLHDIGKLGVNLSYINKKGPLTKNEQISMRQHPLFGGTILAPLGYLHKEVQLIKHHHERWDGEGYPFQLKKGQISLLTGVLSVCDAYDAMTSNRSYRNKMPVDKALKEIKNNRSKQFHPQAVDAFAAAL